MTQVLLLASRLNTLDLNYFKRKIEHPTLKKMLFGEGFEKLREMDEFLKELDIENLNFDEQLAIDCFNRKLGFLDESDLKTLYYEKVEAAKDTINNYYDYYSDYNPISISK